MFTYDLANSIGLVRLEIGDTDFEAGIRPDGTNLSDEELQVFLDREGSVLGASAAALEVVTRLWRRRADITVGDVSRQSSQVANGLERDAKALRVQIAEAEAVSDVGWTSVQRLGYIEPCTSEWG